ncbi:TPA: hypothetical protein ACRR6V_002443 [Enterobacter hormaechei]
MATQPTNLPVPSESPRDLKFNAGKIDEFVTSLVNTYVDRFGNEHYTIEGLRVLAQQAIAQYGWVPVGTFQDGATLTLPNQILKDTTDGEYYRWDGSFLPSGKVVPNGSTPGSTGGVGVGAWLSVGDSTLRGMLAAPGGADWIDGGSLTRFKKRGSFAAGGTVQTRTDALIHSDGFYYINTGGTLPVTVAAGSSPDSAWLCVGLLGFYPTNFALNFGVSDTGDMTERVRKMHAYCNYSGEEAVYYGLKTVSIKSTADIAVNTGIDGCGVTLKFPQDQVLPDWTFIPAFRVSDPLTPLETVPETWSSGTLLADRTTLTNTTYSFKEGVICFDTQINFGKRYVTDSVFYKLRQVFKVFQGGVLEYPIDISISGGTLGTVQFRKQPGAWLSIRNIVIDVSSSPQLQAFSIERNKCHMDKIQFINDTNINNIRTVIYLSKVCDIYLSNWLGVGNDYNGTASYLLGGDFVASLTVENCGVDGGAPSVGFNVINGVRVTGSHLNRFDAHAFFHNFFTENSTYGVYGVTYGVGGGILSVKDCVFIKGKVPGRGDFTTIGEYDLITARGDYGGIFYGNIIVDGVVVKLDTSVDLSGGTDDNPYKINVISFVSGGDYGFTEKKPWAYTISVSNVIVKAPSFSYNFDFGVASFGAGLTTGSLFPDNINIDTIRFMWAPEDKHHIIPVTFPPYGNTFCRGAAGKAGGNSRIKISNVRSICSRARLPARSSIGLTPATSTQTDPNRLVPAITILDCEGISLRYSINGGIVRVEGSEIRDFSTFSGTESTPDIQFTGCRFYFVDGSQSQLANCRLFSSRIVRQSAATSQVQFSGILAAQGNTLASGITLANGGTTAITETSIFMGYKA